MLVKLSSLLILFLASSKTVKLNLWPMGQILACHPACGLLKGPEIWWQWGVVAALFPVLQQLMVPPLPRLLYGQITDQPCVPTPAWIWPIDWPPAQDPAYELALSSPDWLSTIALELKENLSSALLVSSLFLNTGMQTVFSQCHSEQCDLKHLSGPL